MDNKELQDFMEILPPDVFKAMKALSFATLLNDDIAASILYKQRINNPFELIRDLKAFLFGMSAQSQPGQLMTT